MQITDSLHQIPPGVSMAPGISLGFLLRFGRGCLPQLEVLRTGEGRVAKGRGRQAGAGRMHWLNIATKLWGGFVGQSSCQRGKYLCGGTCPNYLSPCANLHNGAEMPKAGVRNSIGKLECATFPQREFQHEGESLRMPGTSKVPRNCSFYSAES